MAGPNTTDLQNAIKWWT